MKKSVKIIIMLSVILLLLVLFLWDANSNVLQIDFSEMGSDNEVSRWGSSSGIVASLGDTGLFYAEKERLYYYDLESMQSYVLCNQANCLHGSEKCIAYYPINIMYETADNVAQISKYVYCTYSNTTLSNKNDLNVEKSVQLLRIDLEKGIRDVVASFPSGYNVVEGSEGLYATKIGSVDYCNGYAWFDLEMQEFDMRGTGSNSYIMHYGVNLQTGDIINLHENDGLDYSVTAVCPDAVYYYSRMDTVSVVDYSEFRTNYRENHAEFDDAEAWSEYSKYLDEHGKKYPDEYEWFVYRISSGERISLGSGETEVVEEDGYQTIPIGYFGEYQGKAYCEAWENGEKHIYMLDLISGEKQTILKEKNGGALVIAQGTLTGEVLSDGRLFYSVHSQSDCRFDTQDCSADIYVYNCNTGTSEFLFTDHHNITFRIYGKYNDGFIGKHKDFQQGMTYYWISEEDFYSGNLDAAIKYQL